MSIGLVSATMSYVYSATTEGENTVNILLITNLLIFSFIFTNEFVVAADEVKVSSRFDKFRKEWAAMSGGMFAQC